MSPIDEPTKAGMDTIIDVSTYLPGGENSHQRLIWRWLTTAEPGLIAPGVRWYMMPGHPGCGRYTKQTYVKQYLPDLVKSYVNWQTQVEDVIGTPVGAIASGQYQFQLRDSEADYVLPFLHLYRIRAGRVIEARLCAGVVQRDDRVWCSPTSL